ncbi:hypothetical protein ABK040_016651, partial [Willaertia magna]
MSQNDSNNVSDSRLPGFSNRTLGINNTRLGGLNFGLPNNGLGNLMNLSIALWPNISSVGGSGSNNNNASSSNTIPTNNTSSSNTIPTNNQVDLGLILLQQQQILNLLANNQGTNQNLNTIRNSSNNNETEKLLNLINNVSNRNNTNTNANITGENNNEEEEDKEVNLNLNPSITDDCINIAQDLVKFGFAVEEIEKLNTETDFNNRISELLRKYSEALSNPDYIRLFLTTECKKLKVESIKLDFLMYNWLSRIQIATLRTIDLTAKIELGELAALLSALRKVIIKSDAKRGNMAADLEIFNDYIYEDPLEHALEKKIAKKIKEQQKDNLAKTLVQKTNNVASSQAHHSNKRGNTEKIEYVPQKVEGNWFTKHNSKLDSLWDYLQFGRNDVEKLWKQHNQSTKRDSVDGQGNGYNDFRKS